MSMFNNNDEPCDEDIVLSSCGPLGSRTSAGQVAGEWIGEFRTTDDAISAVKAWMETNKFWPTVWYCSDHGNMSVMTL